MIESEWKSSLSEQMTRGDTHLVFDDEVRTRTIEQKVGDRKWNTVQVTEINAPPWVPMSQSVKEKTICKYGAHLVATHGSTGSRASTQVQDIFKGKFAVKDITPAAQARANEKAVTQGMATLHGSGKDCSDVLSAIDVEVVMHSPFVFLIFVMRTLFFADLTLGMV